MGGSTNTDQSQKQQAVSNPWAPTQPMLNNVLGTLGSSYNPSVTGAQSGALDNLMSSASGIPNFSGAATGAVNTMLGGGGANNYAPMLSGAYGDLTKTLGQFTNPDNLNPMKTPGFGDALSTVNNDITNQVNDQFAASGRDLSPANTTALARGLSQGEGSLIQGQYNQNVGNAMNAANSMFGGAGSTVSGLSGLNQTRLGNMASGITAAGAIPGLATAPASTMLSAANTAYGQPYANLSPIMSNLLPIASLGGQTSGTSTGTQSQTSPWYTTALGAGLMGASLFSGGSSSAASGIKGLFS